MPEGKPEIREFELPVVLSVTTGFLLVPNHEFGRLIELMSYVKQETLLHPGDNPDNAMGTLHKAALECTPWIHEQFPALATLPKPPKKGWKEWLSSAEGAVGKRLCLRPMPLAKVGWTPSQKDWEMLSQPGPKGGQKKSAGNDR